MPDRIGQQLGNYRLTGLLGQGGVADVYLGEHIYLGTKAAIKVLRVQMTTPQDRQQFFAEARIITNLNHSNIVRLWDFGVENQSSLPYFIMDYAPDGTLRDHFTAGSVLSVAAILPYVKQVAAALQYVHDQKLVHRDVKPENMLLEQDDHVLLSDFGIAVVDHSTRSRVLQDKVGTPYYMAPEQIRGLACSASDQYSLGIVVYEWLCGTYPFDGSTDIEIAVKQIHEPPPALRSHVPAILADVEWVVLKALEKEPQQRFNSVQAFAAALEQASQLSLQQVALPPRNTPTLGIAIPSKVQALTIQSPMPAPQKPHGLRTLALIGLSLALITFTIFGAIYYHNYQVHENEQSNATATANANATAIVNYIATANAATANANATATASVVAANPYPAYLPGHGTAALYDPLHDDSSYRWVVSGDSCNFKNGGYDVSNATRNGYFIQCGLNSLSFRNFAFEVQMTIIRGDCGGIVFRNGGNDYLYHFYICPDGTYGLDKINTNTGVAVSFANPPRQYNSSITGGLNQLNLIAVAAQGSTIMLFVNRQQLATVQDSSSETGSISLTAFANTNSTEIIFNNARVWTL